MSSRSTYFPLKNFTVIQLSGAKTQEFLQGQVTCDMRLIHMHGQNSLAAICDHRGRMLANFWMIRWHEQYLLLLPKDLSSMVANHLKKYAVFSKVMVSEGAQFNSAEINDDATECSHMTSNNLAVIALPNPTRHLIVFQQNAPPLMLNDAIDENIGLNDDLFRKRNITDGLCILSEKTSLLFIPQMINLEKLGGVSFTKGCYVGQEIIARTQHLGKLKRHLQRSQLHSTHTVNPGDAIEQGVVADCVAINKNEYDALIVMVQ